MSEHINHAQVAIDLISNELATYVQVEDPVMLCETVWNGLCEAERHGWHTRGEIEELYFAWYENYMGRSPEAPNVA